MSHFARMYGDSLWQTGAAPAGSSPASASRLPTKSVVQVPRPPTANASSAPQSKRTPTAPRTAASGAGAEALAPLMDNTWPSITGTCSCIGYSAREVLLLCLNLCDVSSGCDGEDGRCGTQNEVSIQHVGAPPLAYSLG